MKAIKITVILAISSIAAIMISSGQTFALTYQSTVGPEFTINPAISVSMSESNLIIDDLNPGTSSDSNIITITASSNSLGGYSLSSTVGSSTINYTDLRLTSSDTTNKFTNLDSNKATLNNFDDDYWGYSYSTDNGTNWVSGDIDDNPLAGYNGLPVYSNTGIKLVDSNTLGTSTIKFKIGAKASASQVSGAYTNTVNFIATAEPTPEPSFCDTHICMQDFTATQCQEQATDQDLTVYDRRDESDYTVRYINNACWMTQNLRITGTISATDSNFSGSDFNTAAGGDLRGSSYTYTAAQSHLADSTDVSSAPSGYTARMLGAWYNYCAASAGQVCSSSTSQSANQDICPAGWKLPTYNTTPGNFSGITGSATTAGTNANKFAPIYGGYYDSGSLYDATTNGLWWSSTAYNANYQYSLYYNNNGSLSTSRNDKSYGYYVRCMRSS